MPTSNPQPPRKRRFFLWCSLSISAVMALWFNQDSVETYWQQQYHQKSPLAALQKFPLWRQGAIWRTQLFDDTEDTTINPPETLTTEHTPLPLNQAAETSTTSSENLETANPESTIAQEKQVTPPLNETAETSTAASGENLETANPASTIAQEKQATPPLNEAAETSATNSTNLETANPASTIAQENQATPPLNEAAETSAISGENLETANPASSIAQENQVTSPLNEAAETSAISGENLERPNPSNGKISLQAGDEVLFIGDSMMQSFAPHMQKWLKNNYQINSLNLGRHSTGLTNQQYYDWPQEAEKRFAASPKLKLVVIMMGANDAWNIETAQKQILEFKSEAWAEEYGRRALRIVHAAQKQGAATIWIGLPHMRLAKYQPKIRYLDEVIAQALQGQAIYIPTHQLLDGGSGTYQDSIERQGKLVRVRHKDGIHLNAQGELIILDAIKEQLEITP